jgi:16S rRNA (uracil1498-N3)-methyltransferase
MPSHRVYSDEPLRPGTLTVAGEEAHHAVRVKRLESGDRLELLDGRGAVAQALIESIDRDRHGWRLQLSIQTVSQTPPISPRIDVCSPAPKGQRLADLIDGLSQVGAAGWSLLDTRFSRGDPRPGQLERLERVAAEASKQCGRPWLLEIGEGLPFERAIEGGPSIVLGDASGGPYARSGASDIRLLIGPEGGWSPEELDLGRAAGIVVARFGPHTMRIETAAVAAAAIVLATERP